MLCIEDLYKRIKEIDTELTLEYESGETCWAANLESERERIEEAICIMEENKINKVDSIIVTSIQWDTSELVGLPEQVVIQINMDNIDLLDDIDGCADNLSDYLSDIFGYCHKGFNVELCDSN